MVRNFSLIFTSVECVYIWQTTSAECIYRAIVLVCQLICSIGQSNAFLDIAISIASRRIDVFDDVALFRELRIIRKCDRASGVYP